MAKIIAPLAKEVSKEDRLIMLVVARTGFPKSLVKKAIAQSPSSFEGCESKSSDAIRDLLKPKDEKKNNGKLPVLSAESNEDA